MLNVISGVHGAPTPPVTNSYESIATVTVGAGGVSTVDFTSIPSTYKHLQIRAILKSTYSGGATSYGYPIRFNSDTGSNYAAHLLRGNGSTVTASANTTSNSLFIGDYPSSTATNIFDAVIIDILDYANTSKNKTGRVLEGYDANGSGQVNFRSWLWQSTSAITSISFADANGNFAQYSSFALYGIKG